MLADNNLPYTPEELASPGSMETAALNRSQGSIAHPNNSIGSLVGRGLRGLATSGPARALRHVGAVPFNFGPAVGGVSGLAGGGALGFGIGKLMDRFSDDEESDHGTRGALIGAALGGLGGTLLGGMRQKGASMLGAMGGDLDYIRMRIFQDPQLSSSDRQTLLGGVSQLSDSELADLGEALRTAVGAGIGGVIAHFLMHAGLGGTILGMAIGGLLGNRLGGPSMLGNPKHTGRTDAYGNPFTL
jgi:hypothetical protein